MIRVPISDFGVIQKLLAGAIVTFFEANDDGTNSGILAFIYVAATGSSLRNNPQTLDENGQLSVPCFVESNIMCEISNISDLSQRQIKKIKANPLDYALPVTNSSLESVNVTGATAAAAASAAAALVSQNAAASSAGTATTQAGIATTQAGIATTQAGISTTQAGIATTAANTATAAASGLNWTKARARTTGALQTNTYNNGASGVGATLTASANGAFPAQDGVTFGLNDRLFVANEVAGLKNGIYNLTNAGSAGTPWILTRSTDADTWTELVSKVVQLEEGTINADYTFIITSNAGGTIGTTAVTVSPFNVFIPDASISGSKLIDGAITFIKLASAAIASAADIIAGTASKIVTADTLTEYGKKTVMTQSVGSSVAANAVYTPLVFDTETADELNGHTNTSRFTAPVAMRVDVTGTYKSSFSGNILYGVSIYKNGTLIPGAKTEITAGAAFAPTLQVTAMAVDLAVNDYIEIFAAENDASPRLSDPTVCTCTVKRVR